MNEIIRYDAEISDDVCMYQLIEELKAEVEVLGAWKALALLRDADIKQLTKELMFVEAERDEALANAECSCMKGAC